MTKMMFILSSILSCLEFWSVNHTSIYGNSKFTVLFASELNFFGEISSNWLNDLLVTDVHKTQYSIQDVYFADNLC